MLCDRSIAFLSLGRLEEALEDADGAIDAAPPGWARGFLRRADVLAEQGRAAEAGDAMARAEEADPEVVPGPEFQQIAKRILSLGAD